MKGKLLSFGTKYSHFALAEDTLADILRSEVVSLKSIPTIEITVFSNCHPIGECISLLVD